MSLLSRLRGGPGPVDAPIRALAIDMSTTGPSAGDGDRVTWLAALVGVDGRYGAVSSLAVAGMDGSGSAPAGVAWFPSEQVAAWLADAAAQSDVVVAHNAALARAFAAAELHTAGLQLPDTPWLCTMLLAKALNPSWPGFRLAACARQLGLPEPAADDTEDRARCTAAVFTEFARQARECGQGTLEQLLSAASPPVPEPAPAPAFEPAAEYEYDPDGAPVQTRVTSGPGGSMSLEIVLNIDPRMLDPDVPLEERQALYEIYKASRRVCEDLRLSDITEPAHRAAHERWDDLPDDPAFDEQLRVLDELVRARCPSTSWKWRSLARHYGKGEKAHLEGVLVILRHFRQHDYPDDLARDLASELSYPASQVAAGTRILMQAWEELGDWLEALAPCDLCVERDQPCRHFDLGHQAAKRIEWGLRDYDRGKPRGVQLGLALLDPDGRKPAEPVGTWLTCMGVLAVKAPREWASIATGAAHTLEKSDAPGDARQLYAKVIETGAAPVLAYERLSLMAERAQELDLAIALGWEGAARARLEGKDGHGLQRRAERCQARANKPARRASPAPHDGELETLTCGTCGSSFDRMRTRGRKPLQCPACRG